MTEEKLSVQKYSELAAGLERHSGELCTMGMSGGLGSQLLLAI